VLVVVVVGVGVGVGAGVGTTFIFLPKSVAAPVPSEAEQALNNAKQETIVIDENPSDFVKSVSMFSYPRSCCGGTNPTAEHRSIFALTVVSEPRANLVYSGLSFLLQPNRASG
jgi:hypothetical protein